MASLLLSPPRILSLGSAAQCFHTSDAPREYPTDGVCNSKMHASMQNKTVANLSGKMQL